MTVGRFSKGPLLGTLLGKFLEFADDLVLLRTFVNAVPKSARESDAKHHSGHRKNDEGHRYERKIIEQQEQETKNELQQGRRGRHQNLWQLLLDRNRIKKAVNALVPVAALAICHLFRHRDEKVGGASHKKPLLDPFRESHLKEAKNAHQEARYND